MGIINSKYWRKTPSAHLDEINAREFYHMSLTMYNIIFDVNYPNFSPNVTYKNRNKLISGRNVGQFYGNRDCLGKIGTGGNLYCNVYFVMNMPVCRAERTESERLADGNRPLFISAPLTHAEADEKLYKFPVINSIYSHDIHSYSANITIFKPRIYYIRTQRRFTTRLNIDIYLTIASRPPRNCYYLRDLWGVDKVLKTGFMCL